MWLTKLSTSFAESKNVPLMNILWQNFFWKNESRSEQMTSSKMYLHYSTEDFTTKLLLREKLMRKSMRIRSTFQYCVDHLLENNNSSSFMKLCNKICRISNHYSSQTSRNNSFRIFFNINSYTFFSITTQMDFYVKYEKYLHSIIRMTIIYVIIQWHRLVIWNQKYSQNSNIHGTHVRAKTRISWDTQYSKCHYWFSILVTLWI